MQKFHIVVMPDTFRLSASGQMTGDIWLWNGCDCFPCEHWNDFIVTILMWWLRDLKDIWDLRQRLVTCYFMDGPFTFAIGRRDDENTLVTCIERLDNGRKEYDWGMFAIAEIKQSVLNAAETVISECERRGWEPNEYHSLLTARRLISE